MSIHIKDGSHSQCMGHTRIRIGMLHVNKISLNLHLLLINVYSQRKHARNLKMCNQIFHPWPIQLLERFQTWDGVYHAIKTFKYVLIENRFNRNRCFQYSNQINVYAGYNTCRQNCWLVRKKSFVNSYGG